MKLSVSKEYKLNMGNFESLQVGRMIVIDILDLYPADVAAGMSAEEQIAELRAFAEQHVEQQLEPELEEAAKLSQAEKSILPNPPPPPRREKAQPRRTS